MGAQAEATGNGREIHGQRVGGGEAPRPVEQPLLLAHQSKRLVVEQHDGQVELLLHRGGQFLDVHLQAAVAAEADHPPSRAGQGRTDGRGQAEAHGAQAARGEQLARPAERVGLGDPHLVLAHVGGDQGVGADQFGHPADEAGRSFRDSPIRPARAVRRLEPADVLLPGRPALWPDTFRQIPEHPAGVPDQGHLHPAQPAHLPGIDVDVQNPRQRAEGAGQAGGAVVEAGADSDEQVALGHGQVGGAGPVHAEQPQRQRVVGGQRAQAHEGHDRGDGAPLSQATGRRGTTGAHHPAAQVEHRPFGPVDQVDCGLQPVFAQRFLCHGERYIRPVGNRDPLQLHVLGHVDEHRPGPTGAGQVQRLGDRGGQFAGLVHGEHRLDRRPGHGADVHLLKGAGAEQRPRHLAGDADHGHRVHGRVGQGGEHVGGPGAGGGEADRRPAGGPGHALGDEAGALLVAGEYVADGGAGSERVVQGQVGPSGDTGDHGDAVAFQLADDDFGAVHNGHGLFLLGGCGQKKTPAGGRRQGWNLFVQKLPATAPRWAGGPRPAR